MTSQHLAIIGMTLTTLTAPLGAAPRPHLTSGALDGAIVVDGQESDWSGALQPFGDQPFSVQAENDGATLYLRLDASSPAVRRDILRTGLTVWFDPKGGTRKTFGIRYPVVEEPFDQSARGAGQGYGRRGGGERPRTHQEPPPNPETVEPIDRVDILGPGKNDARSLTRDHLDGIEVAARMNGDELVYELKVPLAATAEHPYAIGAAAGQTIGIGFETPKVEPPAFHGGRGGFGGGGYGGGHRGPGGERGGGGERTSGQQPKPLKAWGTLTLR